MKIEVEIIEPMLGTLSGQKDIAKKYILSKNPNPTGDEEEAVDNIDEELTNSSTLFPSDENGRFLWDYQIKGFFKDAMQALITSGQWTAEEIKRVGLTKYAYKRTIDQHLFIKPRKIYLRLSGEPFFVERPLRGETMRGERIALARSEAVPAGTKFEFDIILMNDKMLPYIQECLDYGQLRGIGQWRNSGMGRFVWTPQGNPKE